MYGYAHARSMYWSINRRSRSQLESTRCVLQAVREELRSAGSLRDSIAESIAKQEVLAFSIQESLAAHAQLQCQHEDLQTLHKSDTPYSTDAHMAIEVTSIKAKCSDDFALQNIHHFIPLTLFIHSQIYARWIRIVVGWGGWTKAAATSNDGCFREAQWYISEQLHLPSPWGS